MDARLELVEAAAFASLHNAAPVLQIAGATCYATPALPDSVMLNRVVALGVTGPVGDATLDEIDAFFRGAGVRYGVSLAPGADATLDARLRGRGFADGYAWMKFRRGVEPAPEAAGLRVEETLDGEAFGSTVAAAYGLPPAGAAVFRGLAGQPGWHLFLAWDGDEPAGAAALFVRGEVAWLGGAGTRPEHRGKGAQTALLAARIERARALGLQALTTETGERVPDRPSGSYRNIVRAGFAEAYLRPNLVSPG